MTKLDVDAKKSPKHVIGVQDVPQRTLGRVATKTKTTAFTVQDESPVRPLTSIATNTYTGHRGPDWP